jgi:ribonuclease HII
MKISIYIDEAGRGPLAWPLYVGAIFPRQRFSKKEYKDSKVLSEHQREMFYKKIAKLEQKNQIFLWYGVVEPGDIDHRGMTKALRYGILRAIQMILEKIYQKEIAGQIKNSLCSCNHLQWFTLSNLFLEKEDTEETMIKILQIFKDLWLEIHLYIDGNRTFALEKIFSSPITTIIHGDSLIPEISMASILAKVLRDHKMEELDKMFPWYWFAQHKGYGTKYHRDMIAQKWPSNIHRKLFLKEYFPEYKKQKKVSRTPSKKPKAEKLF